MPSLARLRRLHWPHLLLLAALPVWLQASAPVPDEIRLLGWLAASFMVLGLGERLRPHRNDWRPGLPALRRDGSVLALNAVVDALATAALALLAIRAFAAASALPPWLQLIAGALLAELGSYALHRWSHREGWLWRVHLLHHRPGQLNLANALTAHPLNALYDKLARLLPLLLLGLSPEAIIAITAFGLLQSLATHANIAGTIGPLDYLIGSAELHRLHHSTREQEAGNFGTSLPLWDQLFGTYRRGPAPAQVGVFEPAKYPGELRLGALLAWPFLRECD
jgi:sterol desaturase/sphingolipid hydroxylase (fatty acid hydroxylase superfamily)